MSLDINKDWEIFEISESTPESVVYRIEAYNLDHLEELLKEKYDCAVCQRWRYDGIYYLSFFKPGNLTAFLPAGQRKNDFHVCVHRIGNSKEGIDEDYMPGGEFYLFGWGNI